MPKYISGVLCRDAIEPWIRFCDLTGPILEDDGCWNFPRRRHQWFTFAEWNAQYQLYDENGKKIPPPAPGKCFEVDLEL